MAKHKDERATHRARSLRETQNKSEKLLWSILRGKQVCGLRFCCQHPIGPFFADFACVTKTLVVEIDGGYHDLIGEADLQREEFLRKEGWRRMGTGSGMENKNAPNKREKRRPPRP
jgi:very-short-patch-repair endonuclease